MENIFDWIFPMSSWFKMKLWLVDTSDVSGCAACLVIGRRAAKRHRTTFSGHVTIVDVARVFFSLVHTHSIRATHSFRATHTNTADPNTGPPQRHLQREMSFRSRNGRSGAENKESENRWVVTAARIVRQSLEVNNLDYEWILGLNDPMWPTIWVPVISTLFSVSTVFDVHRTALTPPDALGTHGVLTVRISRAGICFPRRFA